MRTVEDLQRLYAWRGGRQIGTRFVAATESIVHENYKAMLIKAKDIDSAVTGIQQDTR